MRFVFATIVLMLAGCSIAPTAQPTPDIQGTVTAAVSTAIAQIPPTAAAATVTPGALLVTATRAAVIPPSTPPEPASLPQRRARQYTFMVVDGRGQEAAQDAVAAAGSGPTAIIALARLLTDGSVYRIEQDARVEIIGTGRIGPHIRVLEGKHVGSLGTTLGTMLKAV